MTISPALVFISTIGLAASALKAVAASVAKAIRCFLMKSPVRGPAALGWMGLQALALTWMWWACQMMTVASRRR